MEWLHEGCDSDLSADFLHFGASDFPSKNPFKKCFKIVFFSLWRRDPVLELQFPTPLRVVLLCFATQSLQNPIVMAALQNRLFFALASRSGFGATISDAVARSSIVFCNSVSADPIVMAASRLLRAVAACVILLSFAAGLRKSSWSGCMKAAKWIC